MWQEQLVIPSRWYAYLLNGHPWGVSGDLLIKSPHLIAFTGEIICDKEGYAANERAAKKLGWTSDEIFVQLKRKKLLKTISFREPIQNALKENPLIASNVREQLNELIQKPNFLPKINKIDNSLTCLTLLKDNANAYFFQKTKRDEPFWMQQSKIWFDLYFDKSFFLIPPLPPELKKIQKQIQKKQYKLLCLLAKLEIKYDAYQDEISDLHGDLDTQLDEYYRDYRDEEGNYKGLNYLDKLGLILEFRKNLKDILPAIQDYQDLLGDVQPINKNRTYEKLKREIKEKIESQHHEFINTTSDENFKIIASFGISTAFGIGGVITKQPEVVNFGLGYGLAELMNSIISKYRIKKNNPFGFVKASINRKLKSDQI